ncbi:uncharacterized protein LOC132565380 [Ylistrum balloti]|uniref:uncharacterized protein LOC132565380 n=1 Tax=Ylistrum balloti TaxID=509963 RepID=UPI002905A325|nr:uncharacterized protein LOC132565380 [Ylistrum balloti]
MVYIDFSEVTMVSHPDFGVFSNNNYLGNMNHVAVGAQQPVTEVFQYYNGQTSLPIPASSTGLQVPVESGVSSFFSNQPLPNTQDQQSFHPSLVNHSFKNGTPSNIHAVNSTPEMSYPQAPTAGIIPQPQGPLIGAVPHPQALPTQTLPVGVNQYPGGFTFNVPTQASPITGIPNQSYQSRGITHCHAPGLGAAWQHAVPPQMPWGDGMKIPYGVTTFTGDPVPRPGIVSLTQSMASSGQTVDTGTRGIRSSLMSVRETSPRPKMPSESLMNFSCSVPSRKLKRHAQEDSDSKSLGLDKKVFISEKKMMQSMKELSLYPSCQQSPTTQFPLTCSTSVTPMTSERAEGLQQFKEIEERLVLDDSDDDDSEQEPSKGPKLEMLDSFSQGILKPTSLLPQKLLEEITNRRSMEVVLWKPPGDFAKGLAPKLEDQNQMKLCWKNQNRNDDSNLMRSNHESNANPSVPKAFSTQSEEESVTMDTEVFDDLDDNMQL